MKKKLLSLLLLLGLVLVVSPMVLSCSDKDEQQTVDPENPKEPDTPLPPVPTPIRWVENEVDGGERGVGIKVTSKTANNFVFECTPGDRFNLIVWMSTLYAVCITIYLKVVVSVQVKKKSKI